MLVHVGVHSRAQVCVVFMVGAAGVLVSVVVLVGVRAKVGAEEGCG